AVGSAPMYIVAGPDGNMWFTELAANKIGRYGLNLSTSWTDTTALPSVQYYYQVVATAFTDWVHASNATSTLMLTAASATDSTGTPTALTAGQITNLSYADNTPYTTGTAWAGTEFTATAFRSVAMVSATQGWA